MPETSRELQHLPPQPNRNIVAKQTNPQVKAVWEDQATLDWIMRLDQDVSLPGGTSRQVNARVKGPQPQTRLLVVVEPLGRFDLVQGVDTNVLRGLKFWDPRTPLACKVTDVDTSDRLLSKGAPVATTYSVNNYDPPRIQSLLNPPPQLRKRDKQKQQCKNKLVEEKERAPAANLCDANVVQANPAEKEQVLDLLEQYTNIFAVNPKVVAVCEGSPMVLELKDPKCPPYVIYPRSYTPEQR